MTALQRFLPSIPSVSICSYMKELWLFGLLVAQSALAQHTQTLDHAALGRQSNLGAVNRTVTITEDSNRPFVQLNEAAGEGLVWLPVSASATSAIEVEMRGKDVLQRSFIGVAFNGLNNSTYEAVYCPRSTSLPPIPFVGFMPFSTFRTQILRGKNYERPKTGCSRNRFLALPTPTTGSE